MRAFMAGLLVSCGGDGTDTDGPGTGTDTDASPDTTVADVSVDIVAADGGTVVIGDATLEVPPGALAADTKIIASILTAASLPEAASIQGDGYDFGPDGLQFLVSATLSIDAGVAALADGVLVVSQLDAAASAWVDLATTTTGTVVSAPVDHFTTFAERSAEEPGDGTCPFTPCVGDVVANYTLASRCDPSPENPYDEDCPASTIEAAHEVEGGFNVLANGYFDHYTTETITTTIVLPAECSPYLYIEACTDANGDGFECAGNVAESCTCTKIEGPTQTFGTGTWEVYSYVLALDDLMDSAPPIDHDYCRTGDALQLKETNGTISTYTPN